MSITVLQVNLLGGAVAALLVVAANSVSANGTDKFDEIRPLQQTHGFVGKTRVHISGRIETRNNAANVVTTTDYISKNSNNCRMLETKNNASELAACPTSKDMNEIWF